MIEPKWVSEDTVLKIHQRQISEFGGSEGVRDMGLLQSAIARPLNAYHYNQVVSLTKLAASYAFGIAKNHTFIDGNKRTALVTCFLFLMKNGFVIKATDEERFTAILSVAEGLMDEEQLTAWLDKHAVKNP
ncbi:MAG: type II toxin-antitoxin system death-on-curing family toxin [Pseudomonadota bacterium]|nr:type II toxin-antitoxin system death-on-curing family toxin [Pseudomonadota bacterium]MDE3038647.1 type II toxin-antitoxin system death-on-curing family toxin [Pseudomonadota bacterium]